MKKKIFKELLFSISIILIFLLCAKKPTAFVSDEEIFFEKYPLMNSENWFQGSIPMHILDNDSLYWNPPVWFQYWYNPISSDKTPTTDLFKKSTNELVTTLRFVCLPVPDNSISDIYTTNNLNPVGGIMATLWNKYPLQLNADTILLDFYAKSNFECILFIDFGKISEDISVNGFPNGTHNYEKPLLLQGEDPLKYDKGIDMLCDGDEFYLIPRLEELSWDTLYYGDSLLGQFMYDPSRDNFRKYTGKNLSNKIYANGLEGDGKLSSEDIDNNGFQIEEHFFRATIDFGELAGCPFVVEDTLINELSRWYHFQIFLYDTLCLEKFGNPVTKKVLHKLRFTVGSFNPDNIKQNHALELANTSLIIK